MANNKTEQCNDASKGLDLLPSVDALNAICDVQTAAARSVKKAIPEIAKAAEYVANTLKDGGRLIYVGSGSSGLMAMADGLEMPGTFGIPPKQIVILLSEGISTLSSFSAANEDDREQAIREIESINVCDLDCLIAVSASGDTPYVLSAMRAAKGLRARSIAIANNRDTPILKAADIAIFLDTPAEIVAGSTRMGAATAQKIALNMISTQAGIHLGHIYDGYMVNVQADNQKLKHRTNQMIMAITGCDETNAKNTIALTNGSAKTAVLLIQGAQNLEEAQLLLQNSNQHLRPALKQLQASLVN